MNDYALFYKILGLIAKDTFKRMIQKYVRVHMQSTYSDCEWYGVQRNFKSYLYVHEDKQRDGETVTL